MRFVPLLVISLTIGALLLFHGMCWKHTWEQFMEPALIHNEPLLRHDVTYQWKPSLSVYYDGLYRDPEVMSLASRMPRWQWKKLKDDVIPEGLVLTDAWSCYQQKDMQLVCALPNSTSSFVVFQNRNRSSHQAVNSNGISLVGYIGDLSKDAYKYVLAASDAFDPSVVKPSRDNIVYKSFQSIEEATKALFEDQQIDVLAMWVTAKHPFLDAIQSYPYALVPYKDLDMKIIRKQIPFVQRIAFSLQPKKQQQKPVNLESIYAISVDRVLCCRRGWNHELVVDIAKWFNSPLTNAYYAQFIPPHPDVKEMEAAFHAEVSRMSRSVYP